MMKGRIVLEDSEQEDKNMIIKEWMSYNTLTLGN